MNTARIIPALLCALVLSIATSRSARAALPIDLEIAMEQGIPLSAPQQWSQRLGKMDLASVRLRGLRSGDRPELQQVEGASPRYRLTAILNRQNELVLPKRKFGVRDLSALKKYLQQLPTEAAHNAVERGRFGLTEKQFRQVFADMSQPVGFSTKGKEVDDIVGRLEKTLTVPVVWATATTLDTSAKLSAELQNLSTGTALAFALRSQGFVLRPEQPAGAELRLAVAPLKSRQESWPVGWKPDGSPRLAAPQLYKPRNIELGGLSVSQTLEALQPALQLPVILDSWVLKRDSIDPAKIQITLPKKRTFLKSAVGKILSQARLSNELRVDEQGQPFLWITRFGKNSPHATE